jgi:NADPH:quinone reductase-like Zn-dependent oxidoreductase
MRVIDCPRFGPPSIVSIIDRPVPTLRPGQILVRVIASTVTTADARIRGMNMPSPAFAVLGRLAIGFRGPRVRVLGTELAGIVHAIAPDVTAFAPGDRVVSLRGVRFGAHAEFVAMNADQAIVRVPDRLSFEDAVALPFGSNTAIHFLRTLARLQPRERILILGGTGAVGVAAVQFAHHLGAHITATARPHNADLLRSLGADATIDHSAANPLDTPQPFDVILDTVGVTTYARAKRALTPTGRFVPIVATFREFRQAFITARGRVIAGIAPDSKAALQEVMNLAARGVLRPVIGHRFDMHQIADAYTLVDSGRKLGTAILRIST